MNIQKLKNTKGITLIALVVTIIILLILAAVSIGTLFDADGLFAKANSAATKWNNAKEEEEDILNQISNEIDKHISEDNNGKKLVEMFKKAQEDNCQDGTKCNNPREHVHVGDYVTNYNSTLKNPLAEATLLPEETGTIIAENENRITQVYKVDSTTTWRVVGLSKDERELIITTGSPIKKQMDITSDNEYLKDPYLYLAGAEGWYHTNDELTDDNILDRACKIYDSRYASKVASMRIEDIETILGLSIEKNGENTKAYKTNGKNKIDITEALTHYFGQSYTYESGEYAPENYLKERYPDNTKYAKLPTRKAGDSIPYLGYEWDITNSKVVEQSSKIFEILFKDTIEGPSLIKAYWLASSGLLRFYDFSAGMVAIGCVMMGGEDMLFDTMGSERGVRIGCTPCSVFEE